MATYNVEAQFIDFGGEFEDGIAMSPSSLDFLRPGDRVNFSSVGGTATFKNFVSSFWTNTSNIVGSGTKYVKSGVSNGTTDNVGVYDGNTFKANFEATVDQEDTTPNAFNIPDFTNVDPKALFLAKTVTINGINKGVSASISGTGSRDVYFYVNNLPVPKTGYNGITNGDVIRIYVEAEYDYEEMQRTITFTVGSRTETFTVTTRMWPLPEQVIELGISPPEDLYLKAHIATFFGGSSEPLLTDYLRGNYLVPSIQQNSHVPKTPPIFISDLYDTASALYFIYKPPDKSIDANTVDGGKTLELSWDVIADYNVGYGKLAEYIDYKYEYHSSDEELTSGSTTDVTIHSTSGNPGSWTQDNGKVWLKVSAPQNVERWYKGTLTIYARNHIDTRLVISKTVNWNMFFWGP